MRSRSAAAAARSRSDRRACSRASISSANSVRSARSLVRRPAWYAAMTPASTTGYGHHGADTRRQNAQSATTSTHSRLISKVRETGTRGTNQAAMNGRQVAVPSGTATHRAPPATVKMTMPASSAQRGG